MKGMIFACIVGIAAVAVAEPEAKPKELKVLMIGNSFSICVGHHMPKVAKAMGLKLDLASLYIGGCSLERHWNNWVAGTNADFRPYAFDRYQDGTRVEKGKRNITDAIALTKWDIVTLQQASGLSWKSETYQPYADSLQREIRARLPKAEFVWQETWSYTPWDKRLAKWGIDQNEMYAKLHEAYAKNAKGQRIIPMGTAVQLWRKELPVKYAPDSLGGDVVGRSAKFEKNPDGNYSVKGDVFHLNGDGEYLQALVWTAELFGVDVRKCPYAPDYLTPEKAELMKRVAMEAVGK